MKDGPDIAQLAALIGDPARANILTALMSGKALTASELAGEAGVSLQTTSSHLSKLTQGALVSMRKSGRHRYFTLASDDVAHTLEALMGLAATSGHLRTRTGPRDAAMRKARVCYNHLAGDLGVQMYQSMIHAGHLRHDNDVLTLTASGIAHVAALGITLSDLPRSRAPLCRECLDWSARSSHLAGTLGRGLLTRFLDLGWATRQDGSRVIAFTAKGEHTFNAHFPKT